MTLREECLWNMEGLSSTRELSMDETRRMHLLQKVHVDHEEAKAYQACYKGKSGQGLQKKLLRHLLKWKTPRMEMNFVECEGKSVKMMTK
ncbi:MAG: hypothetical protein QW739_03945 [Candidatus Odinarchaeota archaeon]